MSKPVILQSFLRLTVLEDGYSVPDTYGVSDLDNECYIDSVNEVAGKYVCMKESVSRYPVTSPKLLKHSRFISWTVTSAPVLLFCLDIHFLKLFPHSFLNYCNSSATSFKDEVCCLDSWALCSVLIRFAHNPSLEEAGTASILQFYFFLFTYLYSSHCSPPPFHHSSSHSSYSLPNDNPCLGVESSSVSGTGGQHTQDEDLNKKETWLGK